MNFGYAWYFTYGQLALATLAGAPLLFGLRCGWSKLLLAPLALIVLWGVAASFTARFLVDFNGLFALPTTNWFASGEGKVLDLGAGTGRSSIVALRERPKATLVALDEFGHSFEEHFAGTPSDRILTNLKVAGVAERAMLQPGDMRSLPFPDHSFEAALAPGRSIICARTTSARGSARLGVF